MRTYPFRVDGGGVSLPPFIIMEIYIRDSKGERWVDGDELFKFMKTRKTTRFSPPTLQECIDYFKEKGSNQSEAETFWNFYETKGWMVGKNKMKKWHSAVANWLKRPSQGSVEEGQKTKRTEHFQKQQQEMEEKMSISEEDLMSPEDIRREMEEAKKMLGKKWTTNNS